MNNLLYYPYINLPNTDWAIRALLYYDNISSIVPTQYFYEPEQYEPFMREVIQNELIPQLILWMFLNILGKFQKCLWNI